MRMRSLVILTLAIVIGLVASIGISKVMDAAVPGKFLRVLPEGANFEALNDDWGTFEWHNRYFLIRVVNSQVSFCEIKSDVDVGWKHKQERREPIVR